MKQTKTILRRLLLAVLLLSALTAAALAADSPDGFFAELEEHLRAQDKLFTISYNGDRADLGLDERVAFGALQRTLMARSPDGPDSAIARCSANSEATASTPIRIKITATAIFSLTPTAFSPNSTTAAAAT